MAKKGVAKTNAMRTLDRLKIAYEFAEYDTSDELLDGVSVARKLGRLNDEVFKTLVTQGASRNYYVFVLPVDRELDLKKCAKACGEKHVEMIPVKDITKVTGYVKGGCSPVAMKKEYPTYIDHSGEHLPAITCSAGRIGLQITLAPADLATAARAVWADLSTEQAL